jgi:hypothetical protein
MIAKFETPASITPSGGGSGSGSGSNTFLYVVLGAVVVYGLYQFVWKPYQLKQKAKEQEQVQ